MSREAAKKNKTWLNELQEAAQYLSENLYDSAI